MPSFILILMASNAGLPNKEFDAASSFSLSNVVSLMKEY
jgi:hypothetical protein